MIERILFLKRLPIMITINILTSTGALVKCTWRIIKLGKARTCYFLIINLQTDIQIVISIKIHLREQDKMAISNAEFEIV